MMASSGQSVSGSRPHTCLLIITISLLSMCKPITQSQTQKGMKMRPMLINRYSNYEHALMTTFRFASCQFKRWYQFIQHRHLTSQPAIFTIVIKVTPTIAAPSLPAER